jgi:undecaprenyl pyrophosphate phosphatase UppP
MMFAIGIGVGIVVALGGIWWLYRYVEHQTFLKFWG